MLSRLDLIQRTHAFAFAFALALGLGPRRRTAMIASGI